MLFEVPGLSLGEPKSLTNKDDLKKPKKDSKSNEISKIHNQKKDGLKEDHKKFQKSNQSSVYSKVSKPDSKSGHHSSAMQNKANQPKFRSNENAGKSKLQIKMEQKLCGARFRYLNQKLYQSHSHDALNHFKEHPEDFEKYHEGFRSQVVHWPVNPVDIFIEQLEKESRNAKKCLAAVDMGCGEAKILRHFLNSSSIKIHSFDLAASHPEVVIADMTKVPLQDSSVDVVIFCLSLMNTNFLEAINEARRILNPKNGILRIAEVESRFENGPKKFAQAVEALGFKTRFVNTKHKVFTIFEFIVSDLPKFNTSLNSTETILKPCLYKKR